MTTYTFAELGKWTAKTQKRLDVVTKQSVNDMLVDIEVKPGITRGGSREKGVIPRDLGTLANSLQSTLRGSTSFTTKGRSNFTMVVGAMQAGDIAEFSWGGAVAPYALEVHYGANGVKGTFWIDVAAGKWPRYVRGAVAKAKARVRG